MTKLTPPIILARYCPPFTSESTLLLFSFTIQETSLWEMWVATPKVCYVSWDSGCIKCSDAKKNWDQALPEKWPCYLHACSLNFFTFISCLSGISIARSLINGIRVKCQIKIGRLLEFISSLQYCGRNFEKNVKLKISHNRNH